jgi:hypothetical protein
MHRRVLFIVWVVVLGLARPAAADLIVTISGSTVPAGGAGFVDVFIESDDLLFGDPLSSFGFEFRITTGGATRLEFVDPQADPQLTDPNYVFFGDSAASNTPFPVGTVSMTSVPNDTFIGGDFTDSGGDVTVTISKLLARLQVTATTASPPSAGRHIYHQPDTCFRGLDRISCWHLEHRLLR